MAAGIEVRHARTCPAKEGGRCRCHPTYQANVWLPREGKLVRKTFRTSAEAKGWRDDARTAVRHGTLRAPVAVTVRQAADELIAGAKDGRIRTRKGKPYKPSTIRSYEEALRLRVLPVLGPKRLSDVRRLDVQELADDLQRTLSASTVQNTLDPLRVIYRRAIAREQVAFDPTENLELARPDGRRDRIAAPEEAAALLGGAARRGTGAVGDGALRRATPRRAARVRWSDVDFDRREILAGGTRRRAGSRGSLRRLTASSRSSRSCRRSWPHTGSPPDGRVTRCASAWRPPIHSTPRRCDDARCSRGTAPSSHRSRCTRRATRSRR
jgi:hypothetical protein